MIHIHTHIAYQKWPETSWQNFEYQVPEGNNGERELYHSIHFNYMLDVVYVFLYMG